MYFSIIHGDMVKIVISESAKAKARDFIDNEKQFQLGFLPTEQSNPITATLEEDFKRSTLAGVQCLQRGDRQIAITMRHVFASPEFKSLVDSMVSTLTAGKGRIIFSGCGATGRLSILLESMWRDFFHRHAAELTPEELKLADRSASIMTGGDFALIKSVEFFELSACVGGCLLPIGSTAGYALLKSEDTGMWWYFRHISGKVLLGWIAALITYFGVDYLLSYTLDLQL